MEAIIIAGGRGSRLKTVWDVPKPLAPIHGRPFLDYLLSSLFNRGVTRFIISVGYKKNLIKDYYRGSKYKITWSEEDLPLGTGGAVKLALEQAINRNVLVVNGDSLFQVDLGELFGFHRKHISMITSAVKLYTKPFSILNGGLCVINTALKKELRNHTMFEDLFEIHKPLLFPSHAYFRDIGSPETYALALSELSKLE